MLLRNLDKINNTGLLDTKEKMGKIPFELEDFLKAKFKKDGLKDRFIIHDIFENILSTVSKIFQQKLNVWGWIPIWPW